MADNTKKIEAIENALASGLRQFTVDGQTTIYQSRNELLAERDRLRAEDDASQASGQTRPVMSRFNLGDAW